MNERLPYEDELSRRLNDLPVPDASGAWEDMKRKLDDEDKKRRIIPPIFLKSCLGLTLLGLGIAAWVMFGGTEESLRNSSSAKKKETREERETERERGREEDGVWSVDEEKQGTRYKAQEEESIVRGNKTEVTIENNTTVGTSTTINNSSTDGIHSNITESGLTASENKTSSSGTAKTKTVNTKTAKTSLPVNTSNANPSSSNTKINNLENADFVSKNSSIEESDRDEVRRSESGIAKPNSSNQTKTENTNSLSKPPDSTLRTPPSSEQRLPRTVIKDTLVAGVPLDKLEQSLDSVAVAKIDSGRKKKFSVSGGIALQQGIPVNGQSTVPYNYYGRRASISDYIPSVYLRLHYQKLFLQGEARYGAPNSVKEVSFARKTTVDSNTNNLSERTTRLKKTYYHQLPLSLNYEISKKISVGTGFSYNIFQGAVTEEIIRTYNSSGTQNVKSQIQNIKGYKDSFLYKSQLQWIVHTEYNWKRLSLGLRFTYDLEPYIRYTLPSGELKDEKNQTLQAILRFRIF